MLQADSPKGVMDQINLHFDQRVNKAITSDIHSEDQEAKNSEQRQLITVGKGNPIYQESGIIFQEEIEVYEGSTIYKFENTFFAKPKTSA